MTIEASSASSAARSGGVGEAKGATGKQGNDADGGGFMAKDAADAKDDVAVADTSSAATAAGDGKAPVDSAAVVQASLQGAVGSEPMDAAALLAQSAAWAATGSAATTTGDGTAPKGQGESLVGQPVTTPVAALGTTPGATGPRPPATPVLVPEGAAQPSGVSPEQLAEGTQKALKAALEAKGKVASQANATAEPALTGDNGKAAAQLSPKQADSHATPLATVLANAAANLVASPRREESSRERSVFRANSSDSAVSPQALSTPAPTLTVSGAPETVPATDAFVAEKVSYWISNNVQNAEMKLDGVGDRPVEVSIRMQGNEAHVAFRTDELQTRAALENASVHLKDMLHREGLVLSGVSVGTAGTGDSGAQDRKSSQGERRTTVTALQPLTGDVRSATSRVSRGGLDLFV